MREEQTAQPFAKTAKRHQVGVQPQNTGHKPRREWPGAPPSANPAPPPVLFPHPPPQAPPPRAAFTEAQDRVERGLERQARLGETPHERHKRYINDYVLRYGRREAATVPPQPPRNDYDVLRERHRFVWEDGVEPAAADWEGRQAKRYYDKLYKEYALADLSRHAEQKLALRWRTEDEVLSGKGVLGWDNVAAREGRGRAPAAACSLLWSV